MGCMKSREFCGLLCGSKRSVKMNGRVYEAYVRTAMVYGGESWIMKGGWCVYG